MALTAPEQIWQDDCYYFDSTTGECMRKYVLVLAIDQASGDISGMADLVCTALRSASSACANISRIDFCGNWSPNMSIKIAGISSAAFC